MKRLLVIVFAVLMVVAPLSTVNAINLDTDSPHILAEYMPDTVDFFTGSRIGEDFIAELDAISLALYDKLPAEFGVDSYELDDVLRLTLAEEGLDYDEVMAAFGNYAAMGLELNESFDDEPNAYVIIEVDDQQAAADLFMSALPDPESIPEPVMDGDNMILSDPDEDAIVIFTPTHMIITNIRDFSLPVASPLSTSPEFMNTLETLPADTYNIIGYVSTEFTQSTVEASNESGEMAMLGVSPTDVGPAAFGATILDGSTFTIDFSVDTGSPMPTSTISTDFLGAFPSGTDAFIVSTDLTNVYNNVIDVISTTAEMNDENDPSDQIPMMFGMTGLDLEEEVLSWTTGSYGVFFGMDYVALLNDIAENDRPTGDLDLDFGIVIEATDPILAQNAADELGSFIETMGGNEEGITITVEDGLTSIVLAPPDMEPFEFEFVLTTTDEFFFLGTRQSYDAIVNGDTLAGDEDFTNSTQYYLPDATNVWYANADGFMSTTIVPLVALGPAIGNVFDNIVAELDGSSPDSEPAPGPMDMLMSGDDPSIVIQLLDVFDSMFAHSTISSSVDADGVIRIRATMSVNP